MNQDELEFKLGDTVKTPYGYGTVISYGINSTNDEVVNVHIHGSEDYFSQLKPNFVGKVDNTDGFFGYKIGDKIMVKYYGEILEEVEIVGLNREHMEFRLDKIAIPNYIIKLTEKDEFGEFEKDLITINDIFTL